MKLLIDGRAITAEGGLTLLEVARANGIFVPSLCDHPALEPYAACRLCLVEVKGRKGFVPACSTTAEDGMEVLTGTAEIQALRKGILELILAEHPHACLICAEKSSCDDLKSTIRKTGEVTGCVLCPANGRCELQRVVEAMGLGVVPFPSHRRPGEVRRDDPFIDRDNSLCILCGRCVRVCQEIRGASVLTFVSRGSETVIGTALDGRLFDSGCQFCGACVDVCPTGSLTDRSGRYDRQADAETTAVCTLCGQGCGLRVKVRAGRITGTSPDPEGPVNRGQACVKGRFLVGYAVNHPRRLLSPLVRENGSLREAGWDEALALAAARLAEFAPGEVAVAASAQSSCEDLFVLHRFAAEVLRAPAVSGPWAHSAAAALRALGRASGRDMPLNFRLSDIGLARTIVVIGEDLPATQPIVNLQVHRAAAAGAGVIRIAAGRGFRGLPKGWVASGPAVFLFGPSLVGGKDGQARLTALERASSSVGGRLVALDREANVRGGLAIAEALSKGPGPTAVRALFLAGPHPKLEPGKAEFVIVQASYAGENTDLADIVFPVATPFETEGTFVNVEGRVQVTLPAVAPPGEARPGWRILQALAGRMGIAGFGHDSAEAVRAALAAAVPVLEAAPTAALRGGPAFLAEGPAGAGTIPERTVAAGPGRRRPRAATSDPDDYGGLNLARENKSLKLVRGR
jgi:NADH dehydrogenase/NADH:ubiquinone oxidoreductase subunit G